MDSTEQGYMICFLEPDSDVETDDVCAIRVRIDKFLITDEALEASQVADDAPKPEGDPQPLIWDLAQDPLYPELVKYVEAHPIGAPSQTFGIVPSEPKYGTI